jgi:hypothetical protein
MNVFEDLLVDLKEENLLEDTVLDERSAPADGLANADDEFGFADEISVDEAGIVAAPAPDNAAPAIARNDEVVTAAPVAQAQRSGREFFKKRAVAEVSSLQMVEHVLTGVEREYMKIRPQTFDDLKAKLALNKFLQVADASIDSEEHKAAEFALMQETEAWCTALAERDKKIFVSSLRQYCENTKPALSSQAVLSLCRFYRNLPYDESVRSKFDFLITRLFSRPTADDHRVCLFKREEALGHLETLYKDWSSVPLYTADDDESKVMLTALSFDDLAQESENASTFDQLIESDFFGRLRMFKESISELFFAPQVAVAAIEANVRIGNSYVKLISAERQKMDADSIQAKYGGLDHESVSDATARTLQLVDLLKVATIVDEPEPPAHHHERHPVHDVVEHHYEPVRHSRSAEKPTVDEEKVGFVGGLMKNAFAVNKWLLIGSIILVAASIGVYVWANYFVEETTSSAGVRQVSLDNPVIREHIKVGKISSDTFYGLLQPTWDTLPKDKRTEYVQKLLAAGPELGYTQVSLTTSTGKAAAYGSKEKIDVQMP